MKNLSFKRVLMVTALASPVFLSVMYPPAFAMEVSEEDAEAVKQFYVQNRVVDNPEARESLLTLFEELISLLKGHAPLKEMRNILKAHYGLVLYGDQIQIGDQVAYHKKEDQEDEYNKIGLDWILESQMRGFLESAQNILIPSR